MLKFAEFLKKKITSSYSSLTTARKENFVELLFGIFKFSFELRRDLFSKCISGYESSSIEMFNSLVDKIFDHCQAKLNISAEIFTKLRAVTFFHPEILCFDVIDAMRLAPAIKESQFPIEDLIVSSLRLNNFNCLKGKIVEVKCSLELNWSVNQYLVKPMLARLSNCNADLLDGFKLEDIKCICDFAAHAITVLKEYEAARNKMILLLKNYINTTAPTKWIGVFAASYDVAKFLKYATREDFKTAYKAISDKNGGNHLLKRLLEKTLIIFTRPILSAQDIDKIIIDNDSTAFNSTIQSLEATMNQKEAEGSIEGWILYKLSIAWISHFSQKHSFSIAIPPRNIQIINFLNMSQWVKEVCENQKVPQNLEDKIQRKTKTKLLITEVSTGEGKRCA